MGKFLTFADYNKDMQSKDGFKSFTKSTKKNSTQTIGDLNCFMTGNELNYAFQQTVSSDYTFGSGNKLIDSFPTWPSMKKYFNPYDEFDFFFIADGTIPSTQRKIGIPASGTVSGNRNVIYPSGYTGSVTGNIPIGFIVHGYNFWDYPGFYYTGYDSYLTQDKVYVSYKIYQDSSVIYTSDEICLGEIGTVGGTYETTMGYWDYVTLGSNYTTIKCDITSISLKWGSTTVNLGNNSTTLYRK